MTTDTSKLYVDYDTIHNYCVDLAKTINPDDFDAIIAPSRGGLIPGVILSHLLNDMPLIPIILSTRDGKQIEDLSHLKTEAKNGKRFLFVDDINDSGLTIETAQKLISDSMTTLCLYQRHNTKTPTDHYKILVEDDAWVMFPWG